jgi:hypothetical protein
MKPGRYHLRWACPPLAQEQTSRSPKVAPGLSSRAVFCGSSGPSDLPSMCIGRNPGAPARKRSKRRIKPLLFRVVGHLPKARRSAASPLRRAGVGQASREETAGHATAEHASYGDCMVASVGECDVRGGTGARPPARCARAAGHRGPYAPLPLRFSGTSGSIGTSTPRVLAKHSPRGAWQLVTTVVLLTAVRGCAAPEE